ncbi:MAG TPA: polyprenyl synthetase family protein [Deltaproteobacteria bacterium]|nr:polyprenyl synthetase family protein [Deltaproteobacteria bacterium]
MTGFDLRGFFNDGAARVNDALSRLLPPESAYPQTVHRAMRYSLFAGGKRLRPLLVLAAAGAFGGAEEEAMNTACAFECIHTYSLIHDDLPAMDDDDFRRGRPACHRAFGEAAAVLAGDALLTCAFDIIARTPTDDKALIVGVIREVARAAGSEGMIGGQMVDIESEGGEVTLPLVEYIHIHKTGELIRAAVRCGAMFGRADDRGLEAVTDYGEAVGLAFQIADDVLDVEGDGELMGKTAGADVKRGKATYPALMGVEQSRRRAEELVERALAAIEGLDHRAEPLRAMARYMVERSR